MKTLIFGTFFVANLPRAELVEMWIRIQKHMNPDLPILLVDSNSENMWTDFVPSLRDIERVVVPDGAPLPPLKPGLNWVTFPDNIGHLSLNGGDGWGRAFCRGTQYAIDHGYDYVVHIESDLLNRVPAAKMVEALNQYKLGALAPLTSRDWLCEVGHMVMRTSFLKEIDFIKQYNYKLANRGFESWPEHWIEEIMSPSMLYYNWKGGRSDGHYPTQPIIFPDRIDWYDLITHAPYHDYYELFIRHNFPELNWQPLYPDMDKKLWHWI